MYTLDQLASALNKASAAGDDTAAKEIASAYKVLQAQQTTKAEPEEPVEPKHGFINAAIGGYKGGMESINRGIAQPLESMGLHGVAANREKAAEEYRAEAEKAFTPTTEADIAKAREENGPLAQGAMWAQKNISEPIGGIAGRYGVPTLAGVAVAPLAPEAAGAAALVRGAGFMAADLPAEMGENISEAKAAGKELGLPANIAGGLVESALGAFGLPFTSKLSGVLLRKAEPLAKAISEGAVTQEAAIKSLGGYGINILKETGANAVSNAATMTGIEATRRGITGQDILSPEAIAKYAEGVKTAGVLAPIFGGIHGARNVRAARERINEAEGQSQEQQSQEQPIQDIEVPTAEDMRTYADLASRDAVDLTDLDINKLHAAMSAHHPDIVEALGGVKEAPVITPSNIPNEDIIYADGTKTTAGEYYNAQMERHEDPALAEQQTIQAIDASKARATEKEQATEQATEQAPIAEAGTPITEAGTPITEAGTPITEAGAPITEAKAPIVEPVTTPAAKVPNARPRKKPISKADERELMSEQGDDFGSYGFDHSDFDYSVAPTSATTGHTAASISKSLSPDLKRLVASGKAVIHDTAEDLNKVVPGKHPANMQGLTTKEGVTHYVANKLTPHTLQNVALHEAGGHAGLRKMVGEKVWADITDQAANNPHPTHEAARKAVPENTPEHLKSEEALMYLIEHSPHMPVVRRLISAVRNWVRTTFGANLKLTEADARHLAMKSLRRESKTTERTAREETAYAVHRDPLVNDLLDPKNRTTSIRSDKSLAEKLTAGIKRITPSRIEFIDPSDTVGKLLRSEPLYNKVSKFLRADQIIRQTKQIGTIIRSVEESGIPVLNGDGTIGAKVDTRLALAHQLDRAIKIGKKYKFDGPEVIGEVYRTLLGKETIAEDTALHTKAVSLRAVAETHRKNAKAMTAAGTSTATKIHKEITLAHTYDSAAKKLEGVMREPLLQDKNGVTRDVHIANAEAMLKKYPEIGEVIQDIRDSLRADVDLAHKTGLIDAATKAKWNAKKYYMPMYRPDDLKALENENRIWGVGTGAKSAKNAAEYKREGHTHQVNLWDNIKKHHAFMISSAMQNETRNIAAEQLSKFGEVSLAKDQSKSSGDGNLAAYKNGEKVWYIVKDPDALVAFQNFSHTLGPVMNLLGGTTNVLRTTALVNPVYWYRQLVRDPLAATFVANVGVITPLHAAKEFGAIILGRSKEAKLLRARGVVGPVDLAHNYNDMNRQMGKAVSYDKNVASKIWSTIQRIHEASDSATRVAVYKSAMKIAKKEGLSGKDAENFAVAKARESINFAVHGTSSTLNAIRTTTPFFSSTLNGLDTVYRAATGHNLNPKEAKEVKAKFVNRAVMMASMSAMYAMIMQSDKSYQKTDNAVTDGNWLIPGEDDEHGVHSFFRVPVPFEVGFLFKTIPEVLIRRMASNTTNKELFASLARGIVNNAPPLPFIAHGLKPAIETATNYDFHNLRPIETAAEMQRSVGSRGAGENALWDWMSEDLGLKNIHLSPKKINHLFTGYFSEMAAVGAALADSAINSAKGVDKTTTASIYKSPWMRSIMTDPETSKHTTELYDLFNSSQAIVNELNSYKKVGNKAKIGRMMADSNTKKALVESNILKDSHTAVSDIRSQIKALAERPDSEANRNRIRELRYKSNQVAEKGIMAIRKYEGKE